MGIILEDAHDNGELADLIMPAGMTDIFTDATGLWLSQELCDHRETFKLADLKRVAALLGD